MVVVRHTAIHGLLEHALDHVWTMPRQQGLDVSHRVLGDIEIVHGGDRDSALVTGGRGVE